MNRTYRPVTNSGRRMWKIVKRVYRNDSTKIFRVKKDLKNHDPSKTFLSEETKIFINETLCLYYREVWNKCKKLSANQKLHQFHSFQ